MHQSAAFVLAIALAFTACARGTAQAPRGPIGPHSAQQAPVDTARLEALEPVILQAIEEKKLPGAVVLVGHRDRVVYQKAFRNRALEPEVEAMTVDTIFDLASLTKVVATTTSILMLVEDGAIRLNDRVATYIPGFERYGKADITVRHLLTHVSGLRPDLDLVYPWVGYEKAIELAIEEVPMARPGERFVYSDINFFLLGEIVRRVSRQPLDEFAEARIFEPLGMRDTMFNPPASLQPRIAPTQSCTEYGWPCEGEDVKMLRGTVHDPTARRMGGVAGHAGLFSTARDLSIFARMLLAGGSYNGRRILSPLGVAKMTTPATPETERNRRGLGWDIDSSFSSNRGELLPIGSFGHTGFTGTSMWIDPATGLYVIFMSNRVHPDGRGDVTPLRARVATIAASAVTRVPPFDPQARYTGADFGASGPAPEFRDDRVLSGIDVLRASDFKQLAGRRVGLVTNHTGIARDRATTIDLLHAAPNVQLVALFGPEHGIRGILDADVPSSVDDKTGLPIHSLYGETRRPTDAMLQGIDTMVIDLQDIGARFYTYMTTMAYVMEEAAKRNIEVVVLDRPNPIGGVHIEGPTLDEDQVSFVGYMPMPIRHGMTLGELAKLFNGEKKIGAKLTVIEVENWRRDEWFDQTGLPWINPSPNMRNLIQALLYPGIGAFEGTNISVGRGTDTPFEQIGAPWIDGAALAEALNARRVPGIRFYPVQFTPSASKFAGETCGGVFMIVTDREALRPVRVGVEIAAMLHKLYGPTFQLELSHRLFGTAEGIRRIRAGDDPAAIAASWAPDEARWRLLRSQYLLY